MPALLRRLLLVGDPTAQRGGYADVERYAVLLRQLRPTAHQVELVAGGRGQLVGVQHALTVEKTLESRCPFANKA